MKMRYDALSNMSSFQKALGNRSLKALPQLINEDEDVFQVSLCSTYTQYYLLVATDKRVFYLRKSFFGKIDQRVAYYNDIKEITLLDGVLQNKIQLITSHSINKYG